MTIRSLLPAIALATAGWFFTPVSLAAQIRINEVAPANPGLLPDADGDYPDWIELYNAGPTDIELAGYGLADSKQPGARWVFASGPVLESGEWLLVFASGKNLGGTAGDVNHWETAVNDSDYWRYFVGSSAPPSNWAATGFDDSGWPTGPGGFGYGDGDDGTTVPAGTISVFYRRSFFLSDTAKLRAAILSMDYDDSFIAYLNGIEIARNGINGTPDWNTFSDIDHEAALYGGGQPSAFELTPGLLKALLKPGPNVLAVEIHNIGTSSSDLTGRTFLHFGISDNTTVFGGLNPSWFTPPSPTLTGFHTSFKLSRGETLRLYGPSGVQLDSIDITDFPGEHTRARIPDGGAWCFSDQPTPDYSNNSSICYTGYAAMPSIDLASGFYPDPQATILNGAGQIRYAWGGAEPDAGAALYDGSALPVDATGVLRARGFEANKLPSAIATASYFIAEKTTLPVVSLVAAPGDLFDDGSGGPAIYDNKAGKAPALITWFDAAKNFGFAENASVAVVGNYSVDFPQKSLQFIFDEDFGATGDVEYPIFKKDKPYIKQYHGFRLRNMDDDWANARMRDVISNRLALASHAGAAGYQHVALFINGQYWGHYAARELLDKYYCRDNFGADPERVDMIKTQYQTLPTYFPEEGSDTSFYAMSNFILDHPMSDSANFATAAKLADLNNWIDYMANGIYIDNNDWFPSIYFNNVRLFSVRNPDVPWKYLLWDTNLSQMPGSEGQDLLYQTLAAPAFPNRYTEMMAALLENAEFKRHFINRFADLLNLPWRSERIQAIIDENAAELAPEIHAQSLRWGSLDSLDWRYAVEDLKYFHEQRPGHQRDHILDFFSLKEQVDITLQASPPEAGFIHISTITPPELPWTGVYFHGNPVTLTAIANPGYTFSNWTAGTQLIPDPNQPSFTLDFTDNTVVTAHFSGSAQTPELLVSEINYHSDSTRNAGDWVELHNPADFPLDVSDYTLQDKDFFNRYTLPPGTVVPASGYLVLFEKEGQFTAEFPGVTPSAGPLPFGLDNAGDSLILLDRQGLALSRFAFDDELPWPCAADGLGHTLERVSGADDPALAESWFAGCVGGSPGAPYNFCLEAPTVSEINYHSADDQDAGDWFEVWNPQFAAIDLSGWSVRDGNDDHLFTVPAGVTVPPAGYRVFFSDAGKFNARHPQVQNKTGPLGFSLSNSADAIRLYDTSGRLQFSLCYSDAVPWPTEPDGGGKTLENIGLGGNTNDPANWVAGCPEGSPGLGYDPDCATNTTAVEGGREGLRIFPQPARDWVTLDWPDEQAQEAIMVDALGRIVFRQTASGGSLRLAVGKWPAGTYGVTIGGWQARMLVGPQ